MSVPVPVTVYVPVPVPVSVSVRVPVSVSVSLCGVGAAWRFVPKLWLGSVGLIPPNAHASCRPLLQGRFSENAILVNGHASVDFLPFGPLDVDLLKSSLRVEHLAMYVDPKHTTA